MNCRSIGYEDARSAGRGLAPHRRQNHQQCTETHRSRVANTPWGSTPRTLARTPSQQGLISGPSPIWWGVARGDGGLGVGVEIPDDQERPSNPIDFEDLDVVQRLGCAGAPTTTDPCPRCDVLLGLPAVHVETVEREETTVTVTVSTSWQLMGCPDRGVSQSRRRHRRVLHLVPHGEARVMLVWRQRVWRCPEAACPRETFAEQVPALVAPRGSLRRVAVRPGPARRRPGHQSRRRTPTGRARPGHPLHLPDPGGRAPRTDAAVQAIRVPRLLHHRPSEQRRHRGSQRHHRNPPPHRPAATATATTTVYLCSSLQEGSHPDPHPIGEEPDDPLRRCSPCRPRSRNSPWSSHRTALLTRECTWPAARRRQASVHAILR